MCTLLISDLHLQEDRPDITRAFLSFLHDRASAAKALYILGDFFEVWVGDDAISPFQQRIADALLQLSRAGTRIFLMHGNRDFLLGRTFCQAAGCTLLPDPSIVQLNNEPVLLMHGDSLCTQDVAYMRMRRWLRHPLSLWLLTHLPLATRHKLARKLRKESQTQTRQKAAQITDVTPVEVVNVMQQQAVRTLIHGHTHRPAEHLVKIGQVTGKRIVLGDWDAKGWVLNVNHDGYQLESFDIR